MVGEGESRCSSCQCLLDYGSQEDGNQTADVLLEDGAAALLLHLLGEKMFSADTDSRPETCFIPALNSQY